MGMLVRGQWQDIWYDTESNGGRFVRSDAAFRNWVTADGCAGPTGEEGFKAESGRYLLYVSLACPWAHRTLIMRALKENNGNRTLAAKQIGMSRRTLHRKLHTYHLEEY